MWKPYLQTIPFEPLSPSLGPSFLEGMKCHIFTSGFFFFQKPQAGYGSEMNG